MFTRQKYKMNRPYKKTAYNVLPVSYLFILTLPCLHAGRSRSAGKGVSYRYGARGGSLGVGTTSWARAPSSRKNAENGV